MLQCPHACFCFVIYWRLLPKLWQFLTPCSGQRANIFTLGISSGKKASQPPAVPPPPPLCHRHRDSSGPCTPPPHCSGVKVRTSRSRLSGIHTVLWARAHTHVPRISPLSRACLRVPSDFTSNRQGQG